MKLRRKIYSWYFFSLIGIWILVYLLKIPVDLMTMIYTNLVLILSSVTIIIFLEYGVFLRVHRINRSIKAGNYKRMLNDYGRDEITDITEFINDILNENSKVSKALETSETSVRSILDDAPILIQCFDKDGNVTYINNTYANHFDIKDMAAFVEKGNVFNFLAEKGYDFDLKKDLSVLTQRKPVGQKVYKRRSESGHLLWVNKALFDEFGNTIEYQTMGIDITEQKSLEEKLKAVTDNISTAVIWLDEEFGVKYASESCERLHAVFAMKRSFKMSMILNEILIEEKTLLDYVNKAAQTKETIKVTARINDRKDGDKWYELTVRPITSGFMVLFDDIDEKVEGKNKLLKTEIMRNFTFDVISEITSCDLKDIKKLIPKFAKDIGVQFDADTVIFSLYEKADVRIVSRWDRDPLNPNFSKVPLFSLTSSWWNKTFDKREEGYALVKDTSECKDSNAAQSLITNGAKTTIIVPISFNHTNIGSIFIESHKAKSWCEIDALTIKMIGRLIGMALRPAVSKVKDGVKFDKRII